VAICRKTIELKYAALTLTRREPLNRFLIGSGECMTSNSVLKMKELSRVVVELKLTFEKPCCPNCD
jgi:hypothetical protein